MRNRDLYVAATGLVDRHGQEGRSLVDFLRVLRGALEPSYGSAGLSPTEFLSALEAGFIAPVLAPDPAWRSEDLSVPVNAPADAAAVDRLLKSQALDMEDAEVSGAARNEYRGLGLAVGRADGALRASSDYYYNWSPSTYVECGVEGAFGGWEPGDETGRQLVPGDVAFLTDEGLTAVRAEDVASPVVEFDQLTWADIYDFLWCGQHYE